jgi:hypothetical protein
MKRRVQKYYGGVHRDDPRRIGQMARARKLCSCWMCGNPRRYFGEPTLSERGLEEQLRYNARLELMRKGVNDELFLEDLNETMDEFRYGDQHESFFGVR